MIKRTFIVERGMLDTNNDRVIVSGVKLPKEKVTITQEFKPNLSPIGVGTVYVEDGVLKCDAEMHEDFIVLYPSIGFKPIRFDKNQFGGVDMQECELIALAVCRQPNMDEGIKRICDQRQVLKCSKLAHDCIENCPNKEDKELCPNVKLKCYG